MHSSILCPYICAEPFDWLIDYCLKLAHTYFYDAELAASYPSILPDESVCRNYSGFDWSFVDALKTHRRY